MTAKTTLLKHAGQAGKANGEDGGADRARTCDLLIANETLYQLSYDPIHVNRKQLAKKTASRNR